MVSNDQQVKRPQNPTPRQEQTRRVMKAYLESPIKSRHLAATAARNRNSQIPEAVASGALASGWDWQNNKPKE